MSEELVDTGFDAVAMGEVFVGENAVVATVLPAEVTATVTAPGLTVDGKKAALALLRHTAGNFPQLSAPDLAKLGREIAMDLRPRQDILKDFQLTDTQYEFLEENHDFYKQALRAACIEWQAPLNTQERIKVEAAAILEDSLIGLGARMQNKGEGLPGVVEVAKLFAKVAGVGEREAGAGAPGERFTINIDLGGDQKIVVASGAPPQDTPQPNASRALPGVSET